MIHRVEREIGGRALILEAGRFAEQANGAVTVQYGDTVVLVTAVMSKSAREGIDFFPLTVDYEERQYAAGRIPGSFLRREGRPSQDAILAARLTDRPLRPLFDKRMRNEVQIVTTVLSADRENQPDILSIIGASAALSISDIPFDGPVGGVRVGLVDNMLVLNPTSSELLRSKLDLTVAGTRNAILMVECGANEVPERAMIEAIRFGHDANQAVIELQEELVRACGKPKMQVPLAEEPAGLAEDVKRVLGGRLADALHHAVKAEREAATNALRQEVLEALADRYEPKLIHAAFDAAIEAQLTRDILDHGRRPDGRTTTQIRPISCEVRLLPRVHGSGLFTRGQTQVLSTVTLGSISEQQEIEGFGLEDYRRFMHHYNFPPYSTGETGRIGAPRRREIGHGALVERALEGVIPDQEEFPYTIRVVSEVLSSNGSTSMASVCASTLALLDAGVPIKRPVAGVAMGLIMGEEGKYAILTDIQGVEDAFGDMDFKVAGTEKGITALQMDIKIKGLPIEVMERALAQARDGRLFILNKMRETIAAPRAEVSPFAPRMIVLQINPEKIRYLIGPGGRTIRGLIDKYKVKIDVDDDGKVVISSTNEANAAAAIREIEALTRDVVVGDIYHGKVTRLASFGAFVEILPGKEGLVHISELAPYRVNSVDEVVKEGDEVVVKVTEIDRLGRINLSRRAALLAGGKDGRLGFEEGETVDRPERRPERGRGGTSSSAGGASGSKSRRL
ncbi:MAG: polyribonucleotide nucleotidyltransferase [Chloroflexota bacterium]|nr:polyribonucleotide nucleotidyltransferase [Dehalococcoidia bacterium]MDW8254032.1 polyribonucleotide nucleotidyltransferase [Chloroflexota bacterium]